jgi:ribonucleotide monophosphatase NagD (HAD superfamily)
MSSLSERTSSIAARISERPRELQEVALLMSDGTQVRGMLHRAHGSRTLDFLNRQSEGFVAMTNVELLHASGSTEKLSFIAINKAHIVRVVESEDAD